MEKSQNGLSGQLFKVFIYKFFYVIFQSLIKYCYNITIISKMNETKKVGFEYSKCCIKAAGRLKSSSSWGRWAYPGFDPGS